MSELLPSEQARRIQESLTAYLTTTFALADADAGAALQEFLTDQQDGIFKGPFLRLRLPFQPAADGWRESLEWHEGFPPYGHQAAAFERLNSLKNDRPLPTLITTGTGSGKTEAFLYPILDHVQRANRAGVSGMKALLLYPMNALANDQAQRLASLISEHDELGGVTAALYTGQQGPERTVVSEDGLITSRAIIRDQAPDIVLTNYKMLDQTLLRAADADIWRQSAHSLQYLVLDEFHTYDGAQGTDVAMLLRRLGLALREFRGDAPEDVDDGGRPLGRITPIATSATLGDKSDPDVMLDFATTVFGEQFQVDSVVTESRLSFDEWAADAGAPLSELTSDNVTDVIEALKDVDGADGEAIATTVLSILNGTGVTQPDEMLAVVKCLPLTRKLVERCADAAPVAALEELIPGKAQDRGVFLLAFVAALSHVRAVTGRAMLSVDLHLWVRELTRVDRAASLTPSFLWSDDGMIESDTSTVLPAIYCRHCGRSGWAVHLEPTGESLDHSEPAGIRRARLVDSDRFRPLIFAPAEGEEVRSGTMVDGFRWLLVTERALSTVEPDDEAEIRQGLVVPVLTHVSQDAGKLSRSDTCPSCLRRDGIRFLGSAIATMLSVSMSTLFGTRGLDEQEKKSLVFTDSVQDAAHRAGFIQARSHSLTLRSVIRDALDDSPSTLDQLVDAIITNAGDDPARRYVLLPPDLADNERFAPFWRSATLKAVPARVRARVHTRLLLDVELEFGLQSRVGRTLELTGAASAWVDAPAGLLANVARQTLRAAVQDTIDGLDPDTATLTAWARGVLERMRERGALAHEWFDKYQREDGNRYSIWGGRRRNAGMPAFPKGRSTPAYPAVAGAKPADDSLDLVTGSQTWYAQWTGRVFGIPPAEGAALAKVLLQRLAEAGVIQEVRSQSGASIYQILPSSVLVAPTTVQQLEAGELRLACTVCRTVVPGSPEVVKQLNGRPCMVGRCTGVLLPEPAGDNFYRTLYVDADVRRVVAREHTSQLPDEVRLAYENGFKSSSSNPDAPNVLVATPTLEMGIDIGDLSTVMLASLPKSVAAYVQRVGRAGRLTGNALNLAFVSGRGAQLPRLGDPLSVINGEVRPPATYLDAEEILRRQYLASVADRLARDPAAPHPTRASEAMDVEKRRGYLRAVIELAEQDSTRLLDEFLGGFEGLRPEVRDSLREWATAGSAPSSSALAGRIYAEAWKWRQQLEELGRRIQEIEKALPELDKKADSPAATDSDKAARRTAKSGLKLARHQIAELRSDYWIGVLEHHGLLPNYTLVDDAVQLEVAFSWIDPDTGNYVDELFTFTRSAALALRDFAPGAYYYARGYRIEVDAVDLGHDRSGVRELVYCPSCGYVREPMDEPKACPRCGSPAINDVQQQITTLELTQASSAMRREESGIDDSRETRDRSNFNVIVSADIDPDKVAREWFVKDFHFGVRHLRDMRIQWTNLGRLTTQGQKQLIAGREEVAPRFRLCAHCGKKDSDTLSNRPDEHRPWCPQRNATKEDICSTTLSRTLQTEGLVVRLPPLISQGDRYAVPSLSAAVLLGLRERIGGAPDHIEVEVITDPVPAPDRPNYDAILLHDRVPGGTGYLADLADPDDFYKVLRTAWEVLDQCPCQEEDRLACHRCLLPFSSGRTDLVSRTAALRHLTDILTAGQGGEVPEARQWELTDVSVPEHDPETHIEKLFRQVLAARLKTAGAKVKEKPGPNGNRLTIHTPNQLVWQLEPQVNLGPVKPDFVLTCNRPLPKTAIFCDGWRWHASPQVNRLADDARKRRDLRDVGHLVLAATYQDLEQAEGSGRPKPPAWFDARVAAGLLKAPGVSQRHLDVLEGGPIDALVDWMLKADLDGRERVANLLPLIPAAKSVQTSLPPDMPLDRVAASILTGTTPANGSAPAWYWKHDTMVLVARHNGGPNDNIETAVVLDDREQSLGLEHRGAWNTWLSLSNGLSPRIRPTIITTISLPSSASIPKPQDAEAVAGWEDLFEIASDAEKQLLTMLAENDILRPEVGLESADGIPLPIAWEDQRVVVDLQMPQDEAEELADEGWTVVEPETAAIRAALERTR